MRTPTIFVMLLLVIASTFGAEQPAPTVTTGAVDSVVTSNKPEVNELMPETNVTSAPFNEMDEHPQREGPIDEELPPATEKSSEENGAIAIGGIYAGIAAAIIYLF